MPKSKIIRLDDVRGEGVQDRFNDGTLASLISHGTDIKSNQELKSYGEDRGRNSASIDPFFSSLNKSVANFDEDPSVISSEDGERHVAGDSSAIQPPLSTNSAGGHPSSNASDEKVAPLIKTVASADGKEEVSNEATRKILAACPPVAEFLYQLVKILTDGNNDYIQWKSGKIALHDPPGFETNVLPRYFNHAKFASFSRQMNYFNFRKIAGKSKMAPCHYLNETATQDVMSLLSIKRRKTSSARKKQIEMKKAMLKKGLVNNMTNIAGNPLHRDHNLMGGLPLGVGALTASQQGGMNLTMNSFSQMDALLKSQQQMLAQLHSEATIQKDVPNMNPAKNAMFNGVGNNFPISGESSMREMCALNFSRNLGMFQSAQDQVARALNEGSLSSNLKPNAPDTIGHQLMMHRALSNELLKQQEANQMQFYSGNTETASYPLPGMMTQNNMQNAQSQIQMEGMHLNNANSVDFGKMMMMAQENNNSQAMSNTSPLENNNYGNAVDCHQDPNASVERNFADGSYRFSNSDGNHLHVEGASLPNNQNSFQKESLPSTSMYENHLNELRSSQARSGNGSTGVSMAMAKTMPLMNRISSSSVLEQLGIRNFDQANKFNSDTTSAQITRGPGGTHLAPEQFPQEFLQSWGAGMQS